MSKQVVVIIPALNPDDRLIEYCKDLVAAGITKLVIVDDGSDKAHQPIFDAVSKISECVILRHYINMGKGRALKNAFNYCLNTYSADEISGVITADSDGQHAVSDVVAIAEKLQNESEAIILGVRDFDADNVPPKSRFGNKMTRVCFRLLHGVDITDTQTGLRAFPYNLIEKYLTIYGERFEYETNMLVVTAQERIGIKEVKIQTLYENKNEGTHFRPIMDSLAIYRILFSTFIKYSLASASSFVIDIAVFQLILLLTGHVDEMIRVVVATVVARVISSIYNYSVNKNAVFGKKDGGAGVATSYFCLVIVQMACSAAFVYLIFNCLHIPESIIKIVVDTCLFILSFQIQKRVIFR